MVLLPRPNNPTGTALPPDAIADALRGRRRRGVVVVDEAYGEFRRAGMPSALELLPEHRNLVVTRTMSKAFALAGARLGYLAARPGDLSTRIRVVRLPYHLSAVTQAVALAALRHAPELLGRVDDLRAERDATVDWLRERACEVADCDANFVLFGDLRRPSCCLAGAARPGCADPRDRSGRVAAGVDRHPGRDDGVQGRTDAVMARMRRSTA